MGEPRSLQRVEVKRDQAEQIQIEVKKRSSQANSNIKSDPNNLRGQKRSSQAKSNIKSDPKNLTNDLQCLDPLAITAGDLN